MPMAMPTGTRNTINANSTTKPSAATRSLLMSVASFDRRAGRFGDFAAAESDPQGAHDHQQDGGRQSYPGNEIIDPDRLAQVESRDVIGLGVKHLDADHPGKDDQAHHRDDISKQVHRALYPGPGGGIEQVDGDVLATIAGAGDAPEDQDAEAEAAEVVAVRNRPDEDVAQEDRDEDQQRDGGEKSRRRQFDS